MIALLTASETAVFISDSSSRVGSNCDINDATATLAKLSFVDLLRNSNFIELSYFILLVLSLPIILNTEYMVKLWLGQNPEHTTTFIQLVLALSMSEAISSPLITAMLATGNIKRYQIIVGGLNIMNLPISYILLRYGMSPNYVFITAIIISQLCLYARLILLREMINLDSIKFLKDVYVRIIITSVLSIVPPMVIKTYCPTNKLIFILVSAVSVISTIFCIWFTGLTEKEREFVKRQADKIIYKVTKRGKNK